MLRWSTLAKIARLERMYESEGANSEETQLYKERIRREMETNVQG